jgi:hypothetical protein
MNRSQPWFDTKTDNRKLQADVALRQAELDLQIQLAHAQAAAAIAAKPFEETSEFRDFVVWLCGYTDRDSAPSQKEWEDLRDRSKKVAAKFAMQTRDARKDAKHNPFNVYSGGGAAGVSVGAGTTNTAGTATYNQAQLHAYATSK